MSRPKDRRASVPLLSPAEQRAWLEAIVESTDNAILGKRLDGTITMWSAGAERMYGYSWTEIVGKDVRTLVPEEGSTEVDAIFEQLRRGEAVEPHETMRVRKGGARIWVALTISPVRDAAGRVIGAWAIARDVTAQRQAAAQLRHAKEAAERASQAKDRFLAVLSHELRTPLTPVLAAVQVLASRDDVPEEVMDALRVIKRNVELEARLIDDLLDLTRISRGKLTLELETADAGALLRDALEICGASLRAKQLRVAVDCDEEQRFPVRVDAARLRQVFWNLLNNAAKFTPAGGEIAVSCRTEGDEVIVTVRDTGVGIASDRLAQIFDAFEQGLAEQGKRAEGLGLGLAICKALVTMHGGAIEAQSQGRDRGASFVVRLPIDRSGRRSSRPERPTPQLAVDARPLSILLVEDHEDSAMLMRTLLERSGHTVHVADTVRTGIALAVEVRPDLIVSDLGLPDGTGLELIRSVRAEGIDCPAIALSGYGMDEDLARTRAAGFSEHLVKPVGVKRLREAIARAVPG